jgi:hypothetical protein
VTYRFRGSDDVIRERLPAADAHELMARLTKANAVDYAQGQGTVR